MKYIKTYEQNNEPQIGDYILFGSENPSWNIPKTNYHKYLQNHIGKLFDYVNNRIIIEFDESPKDRGVFGSFYDGETGKRYIDGLPMSSNRKRNPNKYYAYADNNILFSSKNKEDVETYIQSKKYNL